MFTFIILSVIVAICILWFIFDAWYDEVAVLIGCIAFFILLILTVSLCNRNKRFDNIKEQYENIKMQVDDYNNLPDSIKNVSFEYDMRKNVIKMNDVISEHKVMSKSIWTGPWYSEEVGNLEKLHLIMKK